MSIGVESGPATKFTDGGDSDQPWKSDWSEKSFEADRIRRLIAEITPSDEVRAGRKFGVHVLDGNDPHSDIGRFVEATVFDAKFKNDLDVMRAAYGPYDPVSTLLTIIDYEKQEPVGVVRLVEPSDRGNITLEELLNPNGPWYQEGVSIEDRLAELGNDPAHTLDVATMAVMPNYRSAHSADGASAALYSTCVRWSLANNYDHWSTIVDRRIYLMMQAWGEPFVPFEGAEFAPYMGSKASLPVHTTLSDALPRVRDFDQGIYDLYTQSAGLETEFVLPLI